METHFENITQAQSGMARDRVMQDLRSLARDSEALLRSTAGDIGEKAGEARRHLVEALDRARAAYADLQEQAIISAKAAAKRADLVVRDHPYEAIGIAFGIGLLVGVLVGRR